MSDYRKIGVFLGFLIVPLLFHWVNTLQAKPDRFHSDKEIKMYNELIPDSLQGGFNSLFAASGECQQCHGFDTAFVASVTPAGFDVNVVDDWRSTMMANSAKDPFWRAKVSHEVMVNPARQQELESKCTSCHAPMGFHNAAHEGQNFYSIAELENDSIALDGVSCLACHQQSDINLGNLFSGEMNFDTNQVAYGPYQSPLVSPMVQHSQYEPVYSEHIRDAGICAGCHTLITETTDLSGTLTGSTFVEQATYHEWLNSEYDQVDDALDMTCQNCHMPAFNKGQVIIAAGYATEPRNPFYMHELVGANTFMLKLLKQYKEELGVTAFDAQFDETIAKTEDMLRNQTLILTLSDEGRTPDSAFFKVEIENLAGHKFPSGYPARRAFIQFTVEDINGSYIFFSGNMDADYRIVENDPLAEPHWDMINQESQVQIYEMVMGDVNGDYTTVLERADIMLKDNRIPPLGFTTTNMVYDTTRIVGAAELDSDFNKEMGVEGTGIDIIEYHIPTNGFDGILIARAKIYYQSMHPRFLEPMFSFSSMEIDAFETMFNGIDQEPFLVKEKDAIMDVFVSNSDPVKEEAKVYPSYAQNGIIHLELPEDVEYLLTDVNGRIFASGELNQGIQTMNLPDHRSYYFLYLETTDGFSQVKKLFRP